MIVIKKLIYSIVAKDYAIHRLVIRDGLFFTIQFVMANIYTLLTSQSVLSVKETIILGVINLLILFLIIFVINRVLIHDFNMKVKPVDYKVDSYTLSKAGGKEFYTIRTDDGVKVIDKNRIEVIHAKVPTEDKKKIGTTEIGYAELKIPDGLPDFQSDVFIKMLKKIKNPSMLMTFKYVKDEPRNQQKNGGR
ncbi:hypothetical protein B9G67_05430 [Ligilactobacillus salivarius]|nr:hypothetical protein B9G67_05430 [Ligilactobacillus salivarius]